VKADGPTSQEAADVKSLFLREFETSSKQNNYLLGQLAGKYQFDEDPAGVWLVPDYYNKIDAKQIHDAAKTYLDMKNRVQVTLMPETK
jgi:predicted Zn-dependent peptidase